MAKCHKHDLEGVFVARTTRVPQPELEYFLNSFARSIGIVATIKTAASTHVTLLESCGVNQQFYNRGFTSREVHLFSRHMQRKIDRAGHSRTPLVAKTDLRRPLRWVGAVDLDCKPNLLADGTPQKPYKLAVGLKLDERLRDQRGVIEDCLKEEFGKLPKIRRFSPHVTFGKILTPFREEYYDTDPLELIPSNLSVPDSIALNGLAVYLDTIHKPSGLAVPA